MKNTFLTLSSLALASASLSAQTTIFSDDFADGDRTSPLWSLQSAGSVSSAAVASNELTLSVDNDDGGLVAHFGSVTLANDGDYIELSFDARVTSGTGGQKARFGLFDTNGAAQMTGDDLSSSGSTYQGYGFFGRNGGSGNAKYYYKDSSLEHLYNATTSSASLTNTPAINGAGQAVTFRVTRNSDAIDLSASINGTATTVIAASAFGGADLFTFDTVMLGGINATGWAFDNVVVSVTAIPETSSLSFLGVIGGALLVGAIVRRRAQK